MGYKYDFRIGETDAGKQVLPRLGIPFPTSWSYVPYSTTRTRGDGKLVGFGYPIVAWTWETLSQAQLDRLLRYFDADTDAGVALHIRTHIGDTAARLGTLDFVSFMQRPVDGEGRELVPRGHPLRASYTGVTVRFTHAEVE